MQQRCKSDFLQHVKIIIAGSTIGSQPNTNPIFQELGNRRDPAGKLHVTPRVMRCTYPIFFHKLDIVITKIYAMCTEYTTIQDSSAFHDLNWRFSVLLEAILDFTL